MAVNPKKVSYLELDRHIWATLFKNVIFKKLVKWNIHCKINLYQTIISPCCYSTVRPFNFLEIIKFVKGTIVTIYGPAVFKFMRTYVP